MIITAIAKDAFILPCSESDPGHCIFLKHQNLLLIRADVSFFCNKSSAEVKMEPVRMASDFKLPRIGRRPIQSTAGAVAVRGEKGYTYIFLILLLSHFDTYNYSDDLYID